MSVSGFTKSAAGAGSALTFNATSAQSSALPAQTFTVRCVSTADVWIEVGSNPTAVANTSFYLPAGVVEYFTASEGQRVAALSVSLSGTLYLRPTN